MTEIQTYTNAAFGSVRVLYEDGKPLFCGADACKALGYINQWDALKRHCRYLVKREVPNPQSVSKKVTMNYLTEGDLYRLITHSRLPAAEQFERWVFDEVLPAIRRTGSYTMPAAHAKHIAYLQSLQREVKEWRGLVDDYTEMTTSARQLYERNRATRDRCRAEVSKLERQIDDAILVLGAM